MITEIDKIISDNVSSLKNIDNVKDIINELMYLGLSADEVDYALDKLGAVLSTDIYFRCLNMLVDNIIKYYIESNTNIDPITKQELYNLMYDILNPKQ